MTLFPYTTLFRSFLIPSAYTTQRNRYKRIIQISAATLLSTIAITSIYIVPILWNFLYLYGQTHTKALNIHLQPKIYDHLLFNIRIATIAAAAAQIPTILNYLIQRKTLTIQKTTKHRKMTHLATLLTAAIITPPEITAQILTLLILAIIIETAIFVAAIRQVRQTKKER